VRGLQVSLFDVSDLNNPALVEQYLIQPQDGWTWSASEWDHHAFSYFTDAAVMSIPVEGTIEIDPVVDDDPATPDTVSWIYHSDFWVFHVDVASGFELLGKVGHDSTALRSIQINDSLYTLARDDIKIQPLLDPTATANQVLLK
jgi:uncharacterized secreted protein with C-terminal beta-propeller domain